MFGDGREVLDEQRRVSLRTELGNGPIEDLVVGRGDHSHVDDMHGNETRGAQAHRDPRREVRVEQELHAGRASGSSRSFTASAAYSSAAKMSARSR
jgi:hypothetical protein